MHDMTCLSILICHALHNTWPLSLNLLCMNFCTVLSCLSLTSHHFYVSWSPRQYFLSILPFTRARYTYHLQVTILYNHYLYFSYVLNALEDINALQCLPIFLTLSSMHCMPCLLLHFFQCDLPSAYLFSQYLLCISFLTVFPISTHTILYNSFKFIKIVPSEQIDHLALTNSF